MERGPFPAYIKQGEIWDISYKSKWFLNLILADFNHKVNRLK